MSSPSAGPSADREPPSLQSVVRRYHRVERVVSWLTAVAAVGAFLAVFDAFSLWPASGAAVLLVVALRAPLFRRRGTVRLRSGSDPETVVDEFASATPPVLAFQWAVADTVVADEAENESAAGDGPGVETETGPKATYELPYLFGLRSASLDLAVDVTRPDEASDDGRRGGPAAPADAVAVVDLDAAVDGRPWGAYGATIRADESGTTVDVTLRPTRRFGLRRLPQGLVAERFYADALAAQGYEVLDRSVSLSR